MGKAKYPPEEIERMIDEEISRIEAANNPLFVATIYYLVTPRLLDCSQDCRDMMDYHFGTQYKALNTYIHFL